MSSAPDAGAAGGGATGRRAVALVAVLAGVQFLVVLDSLAVAIALPAIGADLRMGTTALAWVVTAYSVALAGGLLLAGRLSDRSGRRPVLLAGLLLLTLGALAAAAAGDGAVLLVARVLQGLGAALAYPPALSLTAECFPRDPWRSRAFAAGAVAGSSGTVAGAVFGGVVTGELGWAWTFGLTVPPGVLLLALGARVLPRHPRTAGADRRGLDVPGAVLAAAGVVLLLLVLGRLAGGGWRDPLVPAGAAGAAVLAGLLAVQQRRAAAPLLPAGLVRSRRLAGGCAGIAANSVVYSAVVVVGTLHLQEGAGLGPTAAGLAFLPVSVAGLLTGALAVTRLRRRWGPVRTATLGLLLGTAALLLLAAAPDRPDYPTDLLPAYLLAGVALTTAFVALTEHTLGGAAPADRGVTSGVFETATHLGGALSVTVSAAALGSTGRDFDAAHLAAAALVAAGALVSAGLLTGSRGAPSPSGVQGDEPGATTPGR